MCDTAIPNRYAAVAICNVQSSSLPELVSDTEGSKEEGMAEVCLDWNSDGVPGRSGDTSQTRSSTPGSDGAKRQYFCIDWDRERAKESNIDVHKLGRPAMHESALQKQGTGKVLSLYQCLELFQVSIRLLPCRHAHFYGAYEWYVINGSYLTS